MGVEIITNSVKAEHKEINWDEVNIVVSKFNDTIVLTTGKHSSGSFNGIPLNESVVKESSGWTKEAFTLSTETITIKNKTI